MGSSTVSMVAGLYRGEGTGVPLPTAAEGARAGDLCVMIVMRNSSNPIASGWNNITNLTTGTFIMRTVWKQLTESDIGGTYGSSTFMAAAIFVVRTLNPSTFTVTNFGMNGAGSKGKPAAITGNVSSMGGSVLVFGGMRSEPGPPPWLVCDPPFTLEGTWNNAVGGYRAGATLYQMDAINQTVDMAEHGTNKQITLACVEINNS
jgi:hypothetical protein